MNRFFKNIFLGLLFYLGFTSSAIAQDFSAWKLWENAEFEEVYLEEYYAYVSLLIMTDELQKLDGKKITITGYYIPVMEENVIIISKYPYANCFFCGGAGLESIVDVISAKPINIDFRTDQQLTFTGTLRINNEDFINLAFRLEDAVLVSK